MRNLKVLNVIIPKQIESSQNYSDFLNIIKHKNINVIVANINKKIYIDSKSYFEIIWPDEKQITTNVLNNNSLVAKFITSNFSILFTGDIEEIAEKQIVAKYSEKLSASILKVAHHGSKTSSTKEFLEKVKPKIALIGVGADNKFGHPNSDVIARISEMNTRIYRTDESGEITIVIDKKGKIRVQEYK